MKKTDIKLTRFQQRQKLNRLIGQLPDWAIEKLIDIIEGIFLNEVGQLPDWEEIEEVKF